MRLRISSRNVEIPDKMKGYINEQIEGLTKYFDQILEADVSVTQERHRQTVDLRLHVNGRTYHGEGVGDNLKVPLDAAVEKVRRQLQRYKSKLRRQALRGDEIVLRGRAVETTGAPPVMPELPSVDEVPRKRRAAARPRRKR
jgi:putative sigma-54 modulation protein